MGKSKTISIILIISIFLNIFHLTAFCETNEKVSIEDFNKKLCLMVDEYDSAQLSSSSSQNVITNRLVIQTEENVALSDTYGAIDYVDGYEGIHILQYQTPMKAETAYNKFLDDDVEYVGHDFYLSLNDSGDNYSSSGNTIRNHLSWNSNVAQVDESFELINEHNVECQEVVVAILDSGIYAEHDYFKNQGTGTVDERIDDSGYAQIDEDSGKTYPSLVDDLKHGTHVAGIIYDNTMDNIIIRPYRVFALWDMVPWTVVWTAFKMAVSEGADIVNMSLGEEFSDDEIKDCEPFIESIEDASSNGVIVVVSAGNKQYNADRVIPGCAPSAITVAATDERNLPDISYSAYGVCVDIAAPGTNINSTVPRLWTQWEHDVKNNQIYEPIPKSLYKEMKGTSMATPLVSAAVAMMKSIDPDIISAEVKRIIKETAYVPDNWEEGCYGKNYGVGIINFYNIAKAMLDPEYSATPAISVNSDNKFEITAPEGTDARIYYTLDGTVPTIENHLTYTEPLSLRNKYATKITAVCHENGKLIGEPIEHSMITYDTKTIFYKWSENLADETEAENANWQSYNPEIVSVDGDGSITGKSKGTTNVTCRLQTGERIIYKVNVKYSPLQAFFVVFFFGFLWI